jgi:ribonuclease-3
MNMAAGTGDSGMNMASGTGDSGMNMASGTGDSGMNMASGTGDSGMNMAPGTGDSAASPGTRGLPSVLAALPDDDPTLVLLAPLAALTGHDFARLALLRAALTLPSWVNEHPGAGWPANACLEFLGDAVLGLVTADALWQRFPGLAEGTLTRLRASLVSEASLAAAARAIGLGDHLFVGRGDRKSGFVERDGALADALEAVLAAAFLDARASGRDPLAAAAAVFTALLGARVQALQPEDGVDPKSRLQALVQGRHRRTPVYEVVGERPKGPQPLWRVQVTLTWPDGQVQVMASGEGVSLRAAEHAAALAALATLT